MRAADPAPVTAMRELLLMLVAGLRVSTQYPADGRLPHVRLDFTGWNDRDVITDSPRFGLQVYAPDTLTAERVAGQIMTALRGHDWPGIRTSDGHMIRGWHFESCMSFPDPDRPRLVRWQIVGRLDLSILRPS